MKFSLSLMLITGLSVISSFPCKVVCEPPVDRTTTLAAEFDRMSVPSSLTIWNDLSGGRNDTDRQKWIRNSLVCQSSSDSRYGYCPTTPVWADKNPGTVSLKFKRDGTGTEINLNIMGYRYNGNRFKPWTGIYSVDATDAHFTYYITQSELRKLMLGTWRATLKQNLTQWDPK